jgi:GNAT superfamily N-acetyltransferase
MSVVIRTAAVAEIDTLCAIDVDATVLFERAGLELELPNGHEFAVTERNRWLRCLASDTTLMAVDSSGEPVGFAAVGVRDGAPFLDQLSVRTKFMRQGIGSALLEAAATMARAAGGRSLWLTTYNHLAWNRPFYERHGFVAMPPEACGPELADELAYEQRWLPRPEERLVMQKALR